MPPPSDASKELASSVDAEDKAENNEVSPEVKASSISEPVDASPEASMAPQPLTGIPLIAVLIGICVGSFLMSTDVFIISTAIPSIMSEFKDTSQIAWYPAAYSLTTCAIIPLAGKFSSTLPLRWVYQVFFAIFLIGSVVCGAATSSDMFIVGRAIAGVGAAGVASGGLTVVLTVSSPTTRAMNMGLVSSMFALGIILAPIIGGAFTERVSWRWCFYINLPTGAVTLASMFFFFRPRHIHSEKSTWEQLKHLDLFGCLLFVPACFMILMALQWGGVKHPWNSGTVIGLFVGGGVLVLVFIAWQWYMAEYALIPGSVVTRRTVALGCIFAFCQLGGLAVMSYYLPEWFQAVQGVSPLDSGVRVLPSVISQIVGILIVGIFAAKARYYNPWFFVGSAFMCIAAGLYTTFTAFDTPSREWIGYQVLQGLGVGLTLQVSTLILQQDLEGSPLLPVGVSLGLFSQYLGATVSQAIAGSIFNTRLRSALSDAGVSPVQVGALLQGGTAHVRQTIDKLFPELFEPVLEAYNLAITKVYYVPVATSAIAFIVACFLRWKPISTGAAKTGDVESNQQTEGQDKEREVPV